MIGTKLTDEEKESVIDIMETIYGFDSSFRNQKSQINQQTVDALEETLSALEKCNSDMKDLVTKLVGAAAKGSEGWLRWSLKTIGKALKNEKLKFNGLACRNIVGASRKSFIYSTLW
ncbi:hypothetical protein [Alkalimarinus coralli]|uniref:hypothetical protein n=1 Tax=Alkalimarinus coralli TaxID=2935863 RepID=UPI00202B9CD3|nr:hypothetical protein [Alkalimarinus coralli]